ALAFLFGKLLENPSHVGRRQRADQFAHLTRPALAHGDGDGLDEFGRHLPRIGLCFGRGIFRGGAHALPVFPVPASTTATALMLTMPRAVTDGVRMWQARAAP